MKTKVKRFAALVAAVFLGTALFAACDNGGQSGNTGNNGGNGESQTVAVESVTLNKNTLTLEVGGEETLTATVAPDNATDKTVTWTSNDEKIATVIGGKVKGVAVGSAIITARAGDKSATCNVTVTAASVAGKSFVFSDVISSVPATQLEEVKKVYEGSTFVFNTDGTCTVTQENSEVGKVEQSGTYTQRLTGVIMTVTEIKINGEVQETSEVPDVMMEFKDDKLSVIANLGETQITYIYTLQAAQ